MKKSNLDEYGAKCLKVNIPGTKELNNLEILLQRADLVKFAKSKPIDSENIESMQLEKEFIFSTKENKENE